MDSFCLMHIVNYRTISINEHVYWSFDFLAKILAFFLLKKKDKLMKHHLQVDIGIKVH